MTSSTCSGVSLARWIASRTAMAPSLVAGCWASAPPRVPMAVRVALTMTALAMRENLLAGDGRHVASTTAGRRTLAQPVELVPWRRNTWQPATAAVRRKRSRAMLRPLLPVVLVLVAALLDPRPLPAQTLIPGGGAAKGRGHGGWLAPAP